MCAAEKLSDLAFINGLHDLAKNLLSPQKLHLPLSIRDKSASLLFDNVLPLKQQLFQLVVSKHGLLMTFLVWFSSMLFRKICILGNDIVASQMSLKS